jgi:hypothetical protein
MYHNFLGRKRKSAMATYMVCSSAHYVSASSKELELYKVT